MHYNRGVYKFKNNKYRHSCSVKKEKGMRKEERGIQNDYNHTQFYDEERNVTENKLQIL